MHHAYANVHNEYAIMHHAYAIGFELNWNRELCQHNNKYIGSFITEKGTAPVKQAVSSVV